MFTAFFAEIEEARKRIGNDAEFAKWCLYDLHIPLTAINRVTSVLEVVDAEIVKASLAEAKKAEDAQKRAEREQRDAYAAAERARKEQERADAAAAKARQEELERQRKLAEEKELKKQASKKKNNAGYHGPRGKKNKDLNAALALVAGTNVVPFADQASLIAEKSESQLVKQIKAAIVRSQKATEDWQDAQIELATLLVEARCRYPADQRFARWLEENEININKDDRAALLKLGQNPEAMKVILSNTNRRSVHHIWQDTMKQLPSVSTVCRNRHD